MSALLCSRAVKDVASASKPASARAVSVRKPQRLCMLRGRRSPQLGPDDSEFPKYSLEERRSIRVHQIARRLACSEPKKLVIPLHPIISMELERSLPRSKAVAGAGIRLMDLLSFGN